VLLQAGMHNLLASATSFAIANMHVVRPLIMIGPPVCTLLNIRVKKS
jgi:hypothetical protein